MWWQTDAQTGGAVAALGGLPAAVPAQLRVYPIASAVHQPQPFPVPPPAAVLPFFTPGPPFYMMGSVAPFAHAAPVAPPIPVQRALPTAMARLPPQQPGLCALAVQAVDQATALAASEARRLAKAKASKISMARLRAERAAAKRAAATPAASPADPTTPQCPAPGHNWVGSLHQTIAMLVSGQFAPTPSVRAVVGNLRAVMSIGARHGLGMDEPDWQCVVGNPPAPPLFKQHSPLAKVGPRQVLISTRELVRHGPNKGGMDAAICCLHTGRVLPPEQEQPLQSAIRFMALQYVDPGRSADHDHWAQGCHRMCGRRANPRDGGVNQYSPKNSALLEDEEFCRAEGEMLAAVGAFLKGADLELERVMNTHHARQHTPRDHTHNYGAPSRHPPWDAPQTTAGCAINYAAFGQHADLNGGFLSPMVCLTPEALKQQQRPPAVMQFVNALAYVEMPQWDADLGGVPTHWFNPDSLHGFRPSKELLTEEYIDYAVDAPMREAKQNTAWKAAQTRAREAATAQLKQEARGVDGEWDEGELELEVQLRCGPLPLAGLLQERCLSHMKSQQGKTQRVEHAPSQGRTAKRKAPAPAPARHSSRLAGELPVLQEGAPRRMRSMVQK